MPAGTSVTLPEKARLALPQDVRDRLRAEAESTIASRIGAPSGHRITTTLAKTFKMPDGTEVRDRIDLIVVDFVSAQLYYEGDFDRDNIKPPLCFAIGLEPKKLMPSENVLALQNEPGAGCAACPKNAWGSDPKGGRGKACKEVRLLAVLPMDADDESELMLLRVSATAAKYWDSYVTFVANTFDTYVTRSVRTTIAFDPKEDYPSLRFIDPEQLEPEVFAIADAKFEAARTLLLTEPDMEQARMEMLTAQSERAALKGPARRGPPARR